MIETAGINRDHVPTVKRIEPLPWTDKRWNVGRRVKQRTEYVVESVIRSEGERSEQTERGQRVTEKIFS